MAPIPMPTLIPTTIPLLRSHRRWRWRLCLIPRWRRTDAYLEDDADANAYLDAVADTDAYPDAHPDADADAVADALVGIGVGVSVGPCV